MYPDYVTSSAPLYAPEVNEQIVTGGRKLSQAFAECPRFNVDRGGPVLSHRAPVSVVSLQHGFVYQSCVLPDGRRAILDILLSGDIIGLDQVVMSQPQHEFVAANSVGYRTMPTSLLRELMAANHPIAIHVMALMAEARSRLDRHAAIVSRLDARERLGALLLDIYDRLRRRNLIARPTFNLPLTQEQLADYLGLTMVHVNRTLRRLREDRLVLLDRHVVIIQDVPALRDLVHGAEPVNGKATPGPPFGLEAARKGETLQ